MKPINETWHHLHQKAEKADRQTPVLYTPLNSKLGLLMGIDLRENQKLLMLNLHTGQDIERKQLERWKGIDVSIREYGHRRYICLALEHEDDLHIFNAMIRDFQGQIETADSHLKAFQIFMDVLFKWYDCFKRFSGKILSEPSQRGIFGELYFLSHHLLPRLDGNTALKGWQGPDRSNHDFAFPGGNIEIKTTIRKAHKKVRISSEKQLDDTGLPVLLLYCITLNLDSNNGLSLPHLIDDLHENLQEFPIAALKLNDSLNRMGYFDEQRQDYEKNRYILNREYLFHVREGFPRLNSVQEGVGDVEYSLMISACMSHEVDLNEALEGIKYHED